MHGSKPFKNEDKPDNDNITWDNVESRNLSNYKKLTQKRKDTYFLFIFFWSKGIILKFNITELFCFLIWNIFAAFEVTAMACDMFFWRKMKKSNFSA